MLVFQTHISIGGEHVLKEPLDQALGSKEFIFGSF